MVYSGILWYLIIVDYSYTIVVYSLAFLGLGFPLKFLSLTEHVNSTLCQPNLIWQFPKTGGPQYRPSHTIVLVIIAPKKVTLILENPNMLLLVLCSSVNSEKDWSHRGGAGLIAYGTPATKAGRPSCDSFHDSENRPSYTNSPGVQPFVFGSTVVLPSSFATTRRICWRKVRRWNDGSRTLRTLLLLPRRRQLVQVTTHSATFFQRDQCRVPCMQWLRV